MPRRSPGTGRRSSPSAATMLLAMEARAGARQSLATLRPASPAGAGRPDPPPGSRRSSCARTLGSPSATARTLSTPALLARAQGAHTTPTTSGRACFVTRRRRRWQPWPPPHRRTACSTAPAAPTPGRNSARGPAAAAALSARSSLRLPRMRSRRETDAEWRGLGRARATTPPRSGMERRA